MNETRAECRRVSKEVYYIRSILLVMRLPLLRAAAMPVDDFADDREILWSIEGELGEEALCMSPQSLNIGDRR